METTVERGGVNSGFALLTDDLPDRFERVDFDVRHLGFETGTGGVGSAGIKPLVATFSVRLSRQRA